MIPEFSPNQLQILDLVTLGLRNRQIAEKIGTTEQVVKNKLRVIFDLSGMSTRLELALWWTGQRSQREATARDLRAVR